MKARSRLKSIFHTTGVANGLALLAAAIYLVQTVYYALTQISMLDEGQYLYKGLLYATGIYRPFQDYGFWTHKAPLSYLIPGFIQAWFGPGLLTGRIFGILISVLGLCGLWMAARKLGGNGWAAAATWAMALNPAIVKFYSIASAEGLVSCLLIWSVFFAVGEKRPFYQLAISAILATVAGLCRQNMLPFLPILLLYIWWQHGWRSFAWAAGASLVVFTGIHALYWPGILRMWAPAIPSQIAPFLDPWRPPQGLTANWIVEFGLGTKVMSFLAGFRFHFTALTGGLAAMLLAGRRKDWKHDWHFRAYVFIAAAFTLLTLLHLWLGTGNSDSNNYNVWGFTPYLAYFVQIGLLLVILSMTTWQRKMPKLLQFAAISLVILLSAGVGLATYETFGNRLQDLHIFWVFNQFVRNIPIPHWENFFLAWRVSGETVPLIDVLANKLGVDKLVLIPDFNRLLDTAVAGLSIGLGILLLGLLAWLVMRRGGRAPGYSYGAIATIIFLVTGTFLSPTRLMGADYRIYDCDFNVVGNFERVGQSLAEAIPPGSTVYWDGGSAIAALLYLPDIRIFPQQIDEHWSYWNGGDEDALARYGFWNESLRGQWLEEADIIIVQQSIFAQDWEYLEVSEEYIELNVDHSPLACFPGSELRVFQRK